VVTGGGSGIGEAVARGLGARGDRVAVLDVAGEAAERVAARLREDGKQAMACRADVSDRSSVDGALDAVRRELGPVEIMVTSAGIAEFDDFTDVSLESWDRIIAVNLTGTFHCLQAALPDMVAAGWGRIVTIASSAGQTGSPRQGPYAASKGGVISLTKTVAREYGGKGITANTIPPFFVETPMSRTADAANNLPPLDQVTARIPVARLGAPEDIAAACTFLCSDEASYVTGQVIGVNGGAVV
jgi:NAD(P)-dependent dehydrogenase (short-subunit alcohol dehydrogenase family)